MGLSKIAIIEETVTYYSENPEERRALGHAGECVYLSDSGNMCAVGKNLKNPALIEHVVQEIEQGCAGVTSLDKLFKNDLDSYFKEEYQGHEIDFWQDIQGIHDDEYYWNLKDNKGLSPAGVNRVQELKTKYAE